LLASRKRKVAQLKRFYPDADPVDWELVQAGQRAQLIKPDLRKIGVLTFGTEMVTSADGTIAGLLGASPGASIAPAVMVDLLATCFPARHEDWESTLRKLMPGIESRVDTSQHNVDANLERTGRILGVAPRSS
ncbi:malate:quinone oxidoreductase, partial [Rhodococcus sp. NPDC058514]|uniref:malate:quinone oxidoreductase n=1 Tax=Rhodococcus sp. NPDC058514 TaxID=3346532 RepID=UPI00365D8EF2